MFRGELDESTLDERRRLLLEIARLIRRAALSRVDFLSCAIGVGERGQTLLNAAARVFATPVRGLRGDLNLANDVDESGHFIVRARVAPVGRSCFAPRNRPSFPFCAEYTDTIPTDDRLWLSASP